MGCDIHIILEQKASTGEWYGVRDFTGLSNKMFDSFREGQSFPSGNMYFKVCSRNYDLFADLADVRGDGNFGFTPKGLPPDASVMARARYSQDDSDLHSHSWLTPSEIEPILHKHFGHEFVADRLTQQRASFKDGHPYRCFAELFEPDAFHFDDPNKVNEVYRVVFCFDN